MIKLTLFLVIKQKVYFIKLETEIYYPLQKEKDYLDENQKGLKRRSIFEHKARVLCEPFYVPFIASVDKDWSIVLGTTPKSIVDEIPLLKSVIALGIEIEVIQYLGEEFCSVKPILGRM